MTTSEFAHLDEDLEPLLAALAACGIDAETADWHDPAYDWAAVDLAVIRSTWDYTWQLGAFLDWAGSVNEATTLANPVDVVRWNTDKRYLAQLAALGVPVVPTEIVAPGESLTLSPAGELVVKPVVSAGGRDTQRYPSERVEEARSHLKALHDEGRTALVQPYLPRVDEEGETGLVFFGDTFSHAFGKGPILRPGSELVDGLYREEHISRRTASDAEMEVAEAALDSVAACVPGIGRSDLLYARVDVAPGNDGPVLMELELVEPSFFLSVAPDSPARAAAAIADRLS